MQYKKYFVMLIFKQLSLSFNRSFNRTQIVFAITFLIVLLTLATISPMKSMAFNKTLQVGPHIGYSGTYTDEKKYPHIFNGFATGIQIIAGLNNFVGISLEGAFDAHRGYSEYDKQEVTDENKKIKMEWIETTKVTDYFTSTIAACLVYTIDITNIVPFLSAGIVGIRADRRTDDVHQAQHGLGLRLGGGFDYYFKKISVGAAISSDRYYTGDTDHQKRILFLLRMSYVFRLGR